MIVVGESGEIQLNTYTMKEHMLNTSNNFRIIFNPDKIKYAVQNICLPLQVFTTVSIFCIIIINIEYVDLSYDSMIIKIVGKYLTKIVSSLLIFIILRCYS